jgi:hypothetical protein
VGQKNALFPVVQAVVNLIEAQKVAKKVRARALANAA